MGLSETLSQDRAWWVPLLVTLPVPPCSASPAPPWFLLTPELPHSGPCRLALIPLLGAPSRGDCSFLAPRDRQTRSTLSSADRHRQSSLRAGRESCPWKRVVGDVRSVGPVQGLRPPGGSHDPQRQPPAMESATLLSRKQHPGASRRPTSLIGWSGLASLWAQEQSPRTVYGR